MLRSREATSVGGIERRLAGAERGWARARRRLLETQHRLVEVQDRLDETGARLREAQARLGEANETMRALRLGEVDAMVISDGAPGQQVFTLSGADRPYRMFVESMSEGAATVSDNGVVVYANRRLVDMLQLPVHRVVGSHLASLAATNDRSPLTIDPMLGETVEGCLFAAGNRQVPVLIGASMLDVEGAQLTCLTFTDLTAQKAQDAMIGSLNQTTIDQLEALREAQVALTQKATHDSLTALPNRTLLVDRLEQALSRGVRTGCWTGVLFVDLDRFKRINDTSGHGAGDDVLRQVAQRLQAATRSIDTVARIGGDEFVVLAPDLDDQLDAVRIADRLAVSLGTGPDGTHDRNFVTASIGISVAGAGRATAELMLHEADTAMYHAKSLGRDRAEVFDVALSRRATERSATQDLLRQALEDRRVTPYYQPIVDLASGHVAGSEALARIRVSDQKILTPDAFIAVAEECGLVVPLGAQMLSAACRDAQLWPDPSSARRPTVAVNLSPLQLERGDLATLLRTVLDETGLAAAQLHLEITETALMELRPDVVRQLHRVRDLGVEVGLDDFGTGYASLTHLRRLPVSFIKVDRSFISGLGADIEDDRIVAAVVELASNLGLRSIAEGIETPQQLDRLRELGCDHAQGYLFARPDPKVDPQKRYSIVGADYPS
jgi:diguanylate cyclase (GGDEF)-like protein